MQDALQTLLDRQQIETALHRYTRGVDRRDWALLRSAYHPDATDDHGGYRGGIDGFIAFLQARHADIEQSLHLLGNISIEFGAPGRALAESYYLSLQRDAGTAPNQITAAGRYIDRFEKRQDEWRIACRTVTFEMMQTVPALPGGGFAAPFRASRRDQTDILYTERDWLQLTAPPHCGV